HVLRRPGARDALQLQLFRERRAQERDPGQFLTETIVQVVADALALPLADLEDLALEGLALAEVAKGHGVSSERSGLIVHAREDDAGPERRRISPRDPVLVLAAIVRHRPLERVEAGRRRGGGRLGPDPGEGGTDDLVRGVAEELLHPRVP